MEQDPRMTLDHIIDRQSLSHDPRHGRGYGILTRTIVHSSVTKGVFPARIRRKKKNDVLFVQDNYVELKQLLGTRLRTVALKTDLDSNIAAAQLIGRNDQRENSPESEPSVNDGSGSAMDVDFEQDPALPANLLVLVLKSRMEEKLMFMFARDEPHGEVSFLTSTFPLPAARNPAERLGAHLAVDPNSQAMAVAAQVGYLRFYALKSFEQMTSEFRSSRNFQIDAWCPIKNETLLQVGGIILKMDFLYPPRDPEHSNVVFLLVLVSIDEKMHLRLYEWDSTAPAHKIKPAATHLIPSSWQDTVPSLLIPLTIPCTIILTFEHEKGMLAFWGIHQLHSDSQRIGYPDKDIEDRDIDDTPEPGESRVSPVWAAWTRPPRREEFRKEKDCFFLGREDGVVSFIQVHESSRQIHKFFISRINHVIDAGFSSWDSGGDNLNGRGDILIIAGNMSDGGLYRYAPRAPVEPLQQKLHNWSFSMDWAVVPKGPRGAGDVRQYTSRHDDRIFMCSGKGRNHGKLLEIRSGTEAHPISMFRFEDCTNNSSQEDMELDNSLLVDGQRPTGLWLLPGFDSTNPFDPAVLVLSYPGYPCGHTRYYCLDDETKLDFHGRERLLDLLLDSDAATLAVAMTSDEILLQITENAVRALPVRSSGDSKVEKWSNTERIARAYIDGAFSTFVIALSGPSYSLLYGSVERTSEGTSRIHVLAWTEESKESPGYSAVHLYRIGESPIALAGTLDGTLVIYNIDTEAQALAPVSDFKFAGTDAVCESICLLRHSNRRSGNKNRWECIVLCGLRNGNLQILKIRSDDHVPLVLEAFPQQIKIGDPTVHVLPDHTTQRTHASMATSAIVVCQDTVLRLSFNSHETLRPTQHRIWTPRWESIKAPQGPIFAIGQFESWLEESHALSKVFCYIDEYAIHVISVDESGTDNLVPQQLKLSGTPSRILYSEHLKKLIVGFTRTVVPDTPQDRNHDTSLLPRMVFPMLKLVDPDGPEQPDPLEDGKSKKGRAKDLEVDVVVAGKSGERIMALAEWKPKVKDKQWPLLAVGSERTVDGGKKRVGVLSIYNLRKPAPSDMEGGCRLEKKKEFRKESPIYAIATIGDTSLVCGHGQVLEVVQLAETQNGLSLSPTATLELASDIRAISTYGDLIFVSTSHDSHVVCQWSEGQLRAEGFDSQARSGQDHIYLEQPRLLLGSDLESRICGLDVTEVTPDGRLKLGLAFEMFMLSPILRFHRASPRRPKALGVHANHNTIIGAALNGSFHAFDILTFEYWQLLRFIQDLAEQDRELCPATYRARSSNEDSSRPQPVDKHVNGHILSRLLDRPPSGAEYLRQLVCYEASEASDGYRRAREGESEKRFLHLASQAFSDVPPYNAYERVIGYLEDLLRPIQ